MDNSLFLLLLFPLAWPFIAKFVWDSTITYQEMILQMLIVTVIVTAVWQAGKWSQTADTEVWNGYVTKKERNHDYYQTSYCCGTNSKGECTSTCYTDHYTVDWIAKTTVGNINLKSLDSEWKSVYNTPDPAQYKNCVVGEPASREHSYVNYVQAVPRSLFHDDSKVSEMYAGKIPGYPRVYSYYKYKRVLNLSGADSAFTKKLNDDLNNSLKTLGAQKQVNIIVILTDVLDPNYRYAIENKWLGGEKNDVIVLIGTENGVIKWNDTITWALNSGNELFNIKLNKRIAALKTVDNPKLAGTITGTIAEHYDRPVMKDYEYLASEVTPPTWVKILAALLAIVGSLIASFVFHKYDVDLFRNTRHNTRYGPRRRF